MPDDKVEFGSVWVYGLPDIHWMAVADNPETGTKEMVALTTTPDLHGMSGLRDDPEKRLSGWRRIE
jgi:hypothetical protein